eukprot:364426-Chlamydomonas_euryale.AAC.16
MPTRLLSEESPEHRSQKLRRAAACRRCGLPLGRQPACLTGSGDQSVRRHLHANHLGANLSNEPITP